jgi:hypothetical protein
MAGTCGDDQRDLAEVRVESHVLVRSVRDIVVAAHQQHRAGELAAKPTV